ncbi:sigma-54-dependent transcriptional regulator [Sphaerotilus microaerophilus]|uniref:Type 4 fimbriae expression regulatory protein PilR n=1 Tax=Sphaerotilus microaerophilus TaxID=2914710 RepID=A0ABM7YFR9_9BURK|nr:sigma-54 dependent transcriptional regulator [Sphaerotilus sp. FB-5]BDI03099.1 type 4 fimbriae expression regulatory protein PilR [Sphaerotilus sp. FB-5]
MNVSAPPSILVVDDEPDLRTLYELSLLREGYDVETAGAVEEAWALLKDRRYQAVITDMRLPDGTGLDLLRRLEQAGRSERSIVITAYGSPENAVQALKAGAYDYLTKPVDLKQFRAVVAAALGRTMSPRAAAAGEPAGTPTSAPAPLGRAPRRAVDGPDNALRRMAGHSAAMEQVRQLVEKVARSMAPVLIQGESGTGKELVARSIHQVSARSAQPFIAVNCGAIPEQLLEAEFFGYRKGAFTGAAEDRDGFFQAARGGTLFLDEIGDLPLSMQSKLLRAIQERAVRPVGAVVEVPLDVRVISATHKDLAEEVPRGRFRQDLYYRLNVIEIRVPALRERCDDLPELCARVLERIAGDAGMANTPRLTPAALAHLGRYRFPGNVRELENLLHRAVALSGGPTIDVEDLGLPGARTAPDAAPATLSACSPEPGTPVDAGTAAGAGAGAGEPPRPHPSAPAASPSTAPAAPLPTDLVAYLDEVEREVLARALERHRYNRTAAGAAMGLTLRQMRYRMARLGVHVAGDGVTLDDGEPSEAGDSGGSE